MCWSFVSREKGTRVKLFHAEGGRDLAIDVLRMR